MPGSVVGDDDDDDEGDGGDDDSEDTGINVHTHVRMSLGSERTVLVK